MAEENEDVEATSQDDQEAAEEQTQAAAGQEDGDEQDASQETETKETKTLLSDDEGDGADEVDPSTYEFTPPEGSEISEEAQNMIDAFKTAAASLKLSQEQFQGLIEYDFKRGQQAVAEQANAYQERIAKWGEDVRADKELGGDNLDSNLATIRKVTDAYGDKELMALMKAPSAENPDGLGLGNHPSILRFLHRVGQSLADAEIIEGDGHKAQSGDGLSRMYPTMFQNAS